MQLSFLLLLASLSLLLSLLLLMFLPLLNSLLVACVLFVAGSLAGVPAFALIPTVAKSIILMMSRLLLVSLLLLSRLILSCYWSHPYGYLFSSCCWSPYCCWSLYCCFRQCFCLDPSCSLLSPVLVFQLLLTPLGTCVHPVVSIPSVSDVHVVAVAILHVVSLCRHPVCFSCCVVLL